MEESDPEALHEPSRIRSDHPLHEPRDLTRAERERFRQIAWRSRNRAVQALRGELDALHPVNTPLLKPLQLMPRLPASSLRALSLFSGGGGLDLGFDRAGYVHVASFELMSEAGRTLKRNRPDWDVRSGDQQGNVWHVRWKDWRNQVDVLHAGPPCQPFSHAGRQRGALDPRDCWPITVQAIKAVQPLAFVAENVAALDTAKFENYVREVITEPLESSRPRWWIHRLLVRAWDYGVPQVRRRVMFVGFRSKAAWQAFEAPPATHYWGEPVAGLRRTMGVREALGLPSDEYEDALAPTIRSGIGGPRNTTSILNGTSGQRIWASLGLWPNGVAATRQAASAFPADNGHFRLSVSDVALIQGFPESWRFGSAVYQALGEIGNAVPPPMGYHVARAVRQAIETS